MAEHNKLGADGEKTAINFLIKKGYKIRHTNWRLKHLELDIVAETTDYLVIIEVKTRTNTRFIDPIEAVTPTKMRRIINATEGYIKVYGINKEVRFDVISLTLSPYGYIINHVEDAFISPVW